MLTKITTFYRRYPLRSQLIAIWLLATVFVLSGICSSLDGLGVAGICVALFGSVCWAGWAWGVEDDRYRKLKAEWAEQERLADLGIHPSQLALPV